MSIVSPLGKNLRVEHSAVEREGGRDKKPPYRWCVYLDKRSFDITIWDRLILLSNSSFSFPYPSPLSLFLSLHSTIEIKYLTILINLQDKLDLSTHFQNLS